MHGKRIVFAMLLVGFVSLNLFALVSAGVVGLDQFIRGANAWGLVAAADLLIALGLVLAWLWRDAQRRGVSPLPYLLITLATGSVGPLLYLTRHPRQKS